MGGNAFQTEYGVSVISLSCRSKRRPQTYWGRPCAALCARRHTVHRPRITIARTIRVLMMSVEWKGRRSSLWCSYPVATRYVTRAAPRSHRSVASQHTLSSTGISMYICMYNKLYKSATPILLQKSRSNLTRCACLWMCCQCPLCKRGIAHSVPNFALLSLLSPPHSTDTTPSPHDTSIEESPTPAWRHHPPALPSCAVGHACPHTDHLTHW